MEGNIASLIATTTWQNSNAPRWVHSIRRSVANAGGTF
jgi:hypothetical protein